jgi:hypothetical protein
VDAIREGKAPAFIRRKGAEGGLPLSLGEKLEVLTILARDEDREIRAQAIQTLSRWNLAELQQVLSDPQTPQEVREFARNYLAPGHPELLDPLLQNSAPPGNLELETTAQLSPSQEEAGEAPAPAPPITQPLSSKPEGAREEESETLIQKLGRMSPAEKVKAALTGNQEMRQLLIRDPNKLVARTVLQSPKLTEVEIETFASSKDLAEEVLRGIATSRKILKNYGVIRALVNNPRVPIDVSLPLVSHLNDRDIRFLMKNRNIPEVLRHMAIKVMTQKQEAARMKLPTGKT